MSKFGKFAIDIDSISDEDANIPEKARGKTFEKKEITWFNVGRHEGLEITSVEEKESCIKDNTWGRVVFTLTLEKRLIKASIMYPTKALVYGADKSVFPFKKLQEFLGACGIELTKANAGEIIPAIFINPAILIGVKLDVIVGHSSNYAHYVEKGVYHIYDNYNKAILGVDGINPLSFDSREACELFCLDQLKLPFSKFAEVRKYYNSKANSKVVDLSPPKPEKKKTVVPW